MTERRGKGERIREKKEKITLNHDIY